MKKQLLLATSCLLLAFFLSGCMPTGTGPTGSFFPTPSPAKKKSSGRYCLTKEELETLKAQPAAFTCNRTDIDGTTILEENVPYVLASTDVEVELIFHYEQKQLILKENCGGIDYYTWKCHPWGSPKWGSIYANTLWKLRDTDPNRKPLKDGDHFDVYLRKDAPDTARFVCKDSASTSASSFTTLMAGILADSPLENKTIRIEGKSALWYMRSDAFDVDIETAPPREKVAEITLDEITYDVFVNMLIGFSPDEDKHFYLVEKGILPKTNDGLPGSITYDQFVIVTEVKPKGLSLQLGTFDPILPDNPWYNVYLPESKPVVYLYPEKPTQLTIKIEPRDGYITVSDPPYNPETGWQIIAYPNGTIEHLAGVMASAPLQPATPEVKKYPYLYYESEVKGYQIPEEGFVVARKDLGNFFQDVLPKLGLNEKEAADFSEYWLGRFEEIDEPYVFLTFLPQEQINLVDPISVFSQNAPISPNTQIRVRAYFKPLGGPINASSQVLPILPQREGFALVEWGGILDERP